ncbi:hypothetical protein [Tsukamurella tyrosinosolvens]|uniref:hypothetical protein n=1 Tax=Tsukamurella tyrosinosolvens TaxID=57704 RepID=UPI00079C6A57|nr:hypothetical protein [Tsukamurella tyrosinosolvens]KXP05313.1 hypothetical protein AXK59_06975 [Tsukamurella tyrosinosolvens]KZL94715.1 hypothetical protein AXX05_18080 [Tsukamurella tyrosinosolvens]RDB46027.1 hypothetical protein DVB87_20710 [Tsukamurella tyrosinosolvens]
MSISEQVEAQATLGAEGVRFIPAGAAALFIRCAGVLAAVARYQLYLESLDGTRESIMGRGFNDGAIGDLRAAMYQPGVGTWFSGEIRIDRSGAVDARFDYDSEPAWDAPVDPIAYAYDADQFPRALEHQPVWLREQIAQGRERQRQFGWR